MSIQMLTDTFNTEEYNNLAGHPMQLREWGEARKKTGLKIFRFGEYEGNELVNAYQMTLHPIPFTGKCIGYIPRSSLPSNELLKYLHDFGKKEKIAFVKFEPNVTASSASSIQHLAFRKSPYSLFPKWTMTLDLTPSEEVLLKNMKTKTRYNIKLAERKGVVVKEMTDAQGFEIFAKLYFETSRRQKYFGHTKEYHEPIFNALKNKNAAILIAFYKNTPLAAYELFFHKDTLYYPYGGSSEEMKNLMAPNLLMWETIRWGKNKGLRKFDMWGSLPPDYDQKNIWAGFTRFKEGYGAKFTEMIGSYDFIIDSLLYHPFNFAQAMRNKLFGI